MYDPTEDNDPIDYVGLIQSLLGGEDEAPEGSYVTLRTSGSGSFFLPVEEDAPLSSLLSANNITMGPSTTFWLNGAEIGLDHLVGPGVEISAVGNVKGA
jgi:hypothetical protein